LQVGCVLMLGASVGFGAYAMWSADALAELNRRTYDHALMTAQFSQAARVAHLQLEAAYQRALAATTVADLDKHAASMKEAAETVAGDLDVVRKRALHPKSGDLVAQVTAALDAAAKARTQAVDAARSRLAGGGAASGGTAPAGAGADAEAIGATLETISDFAADTGFQLREQGKALAQRTMRVGYAALALSVLTTALVCLLLYRAVVPPIRRFGACLDALAAGDLTRHAESEGRDEVGAMARRYNEVVATMRDTLGHVRTSSDGVAEGAKMTSGATGALARQAQTQAASLEETAATLEELTATVKRNAENAQQANQLAEDSRRVAERGGQVVTEAVTAMGEINHASRRIADITGNIDEIAFQTNLLALNAAVEAARAGEQGRGFAVVAAEVRTLAHRAASAAREIKELIHDSVGKVEAGSERVNHSGRALTEIVASVQRVTAIIGEIAVASREQSSGIDQVNRALTQMDGLVQSNAAQTEELSATARSLAGRAQELQRLVGRFTIDRGDASERAGDTLPERRQLPGEPLRQLGVHPARVLLRHPVA
jgi:methyl-accepting chemotaxis protein